MSELDLGLDLGIPDVRVLPGIAANAARWAQIAERMRNSVFNRSEGFQVEIGAPQEVSGPLLASATEVVARFNRFYDDVVRAYFERPDLRADHLVNPVIERLLDIEAERASPTPLSRFDAVLDQTGRLRIIELNSVGVCLVHLRSLFYTIRELARRGLSDDARRLDATAQQMVHGFLAFCRPRLKSPPARIVVGSVTGSGWYRATQLLFRGVFERAGCDYVFGGPEHLEVTDKDIRVRGTRVDVLWADFFVYLGYQFARYKDTKFPTAVPDYGKAPAQLEELLANRHFYDHLRSGNVVNISPARSYLALPKALLSWIHRSDRPITESDRAFLADHVARTYSARDRADGMIALDDAVERRGELLIKPCQYGGSHGVQVGSMLDRDAWKQRLVAIWDDPGWAIQHFHEPFEMRGGQRVSVGLSNYDGVMGGMYFRTSKSLLVNARDSAFIPIVA